MLDHGIFLMVRQDHQKMLLNTVWKFVKPVNGFVREHKPARNVDVL
jgi:hypothetical protein